MANLFLDLPAIAGNGSGAAVDVSAMGGLKTVTVSRNAGVFQPFVTVEFSNEAVPTVWTPLKTFSAAGQQSFIVACLWMRVTVSNYRGGGAPNCDVASDDAGTSALNLPALAVSGAAAPVDVSALENLKTIQVGGQFRGAVNIELSVDGSDYETVASFKSPGQFTAGFAAQFMRVVRAGVPDVAPGLPEVNVGATAGGGGGGGSVGPGTADTVAKFTSPNTIGDSSITDDGVTVIANANVGITGALAVTGTALLGADADVAGDAFVGGSLVAEGPVVLDGPLSDVLAVGTTNDYAPAGIELANRLRLEADVGGSALGGIDTQNFVDGQQLDIVNLGPGTLTLIHDEPGSLAQNRFQLEGGVDRDVLINGLVTTVFDAVSGCLFVKG